MGTGSLEEFTTKHQTNVSAIHSTQLIVFGVGVRVGEGNLIAGCKHSSNHSIKHME